MSLSAFPHRQIHLDFHTSPWIGDMGADFDPEAFADQMVAAARYPLPDLYQIH